MATPQLPVEATRNSPSAREPLISGGPSRAGGVPFAPAAITETPAGWLAAASGERTNAIAKAKTMMAAIRIPGRNPCVAGRCDSSGLMVDLHCHILPGLDDGAATIEHALELARAAQAAGIDTVVATPHIRDDYPFPLELIAERLSELQGALRHAEIEVNVVAGGEVALSKLPELDDEQLAPLCLGQGRYLLVESPYTHAPSLLETALFDLQVRGFRPVLAHPERSVTFLGDRARLEALVEQGVACSVTAMSVAGGFGTAIRDFTMDLFASGLVHNIASDSHDAGRRAPGFGAAFERMEDTLDCAAEEAHWFVEDAPRALCEGRELPGQSPSLTIRRTGWTRIKGCVGLD